MRAPAKDAISHIITVIGVGVIVVVFVALLAQTRTLSENINNQTLINQRYLRCILLIPPEQFRDAESRVAAIDKCAEESRLPSGERLGDR